MKKIIAIVGMCGSGKSQAVEYFIKNNYSIVYFGGITIEKMKEEQIEINPENEKKMQKRLREEYGMGAYAKLSLPKIKELIKENDVIIDGVYSWDELKILQDEFQNQVTTIALITDKRIRYERLNIRKIRPYTNEEAKSRDIFEIENTAKGGPIAYADYYVFNNGSLKDLTKRLEEIESLIKEDDYELI